ncbi:hypothetical protein [Streptosporangium sp. NPDC006007]|uniref:hypothetical protein n=1 Tax=Streptosporangium sp. NPDC006007 TaxID=3154575 RepID=UPI0033A61493
MTRRVVLRVGIVLAIVSASTLTMALTMSGLEAADKLGSVIGAIVSTVGLVTATFITPQSDDGPVESPSEREGTGRRAEGVSRLALQRMFSPRELCWFIPIFVGTGLGGVVFLAHYSKNGVNEPLLLAGLAISFSIALFYRPRAPRTTVERRSLWWMLSASAAIGVLLASTVWFILHKPDRSVTGIAEFNVKEMKEGDSAQITFSSPPAGYENLALTLSLTNLDSTGNCVVPARLEVTPEVVGVPGQISSRSSVKDVSSGKEVRLPVAGIERGGHILVTLNKVNKGCKVKPEVSEAVLFN